MFDIHRDAIELSDGSKARMVTAADGQIAAQLVGDNRRGHGLLAVPHGFHDLKFRVGKFFY